MLLIGKLRWKSIWRKDYWNFKF